MPKGKREPDPRWRRGGVGYSALRLDLGADGYTLVRCIVDGTAWRLVTLMFGAQEICGVRDTPRDAQLAGEDAAARLLRDAARTQKRRGRA